jgi:DNA-directed RNA polymerase subunit M/transcription elongation factor TFIIS
MSHSLRDRTIEIIKSIDKIGLKNVEIKDLEIGIFNWTIDFSTKNNIIKNWENLKFKQTYINKAVSVIANLDVNNYLKNNYLLKIVKNKEIKPHEIAYMKSEDIFPEKWKNIQTDLKRKEDGSKVNKNVSITDQFRCGKCKKRECSYYELQIRSADESATLFITCLNCNTKWRQ